MGVRATRIPLQTGASVIDRLVPAAVSLCLSAAVWTLLRVLDHAAGDSTTTKVLFGLVLGGFSVIMAALGLAYVPAALRARAVDAVMEGDGLRVEGDPIGARRILWADIDVAQTGITNELYSARRTQRLGASETNESTYAHRLAVVLRDGSRRDLAVAVDAEEQRSLDCLLETMRYEHARKRDGDAGVVAPTGPTSGPDVLRCESCGAAVRLALADHVKCDYCAADVAVPAAHRERIQAAAALADQRRAARRIVPALLSQPGATRVNVVLVAWLAATVSTVILAALRISVPSVLIGVGASLALFEWARMLFTERRMLRSLVVDFAARAPERPGGAPCCHRCGAPLPVSRVEGELVQDCAYCHAENLLGVDVRREALGGSAVVQELSASLEQRRQDRARHQFGLVAALLIAIAGALARMRGL